ncbi:FAD-dependent monooxygenase [Tsukamurella sp. 1534]|uniref:FAD-dependent monooxygenase n=1 Tax=Tsukamurella sp. 1534 TaxID=1151061 RepID=UPI0003155EFE|nr:FAD-dependent monooxygenase [Tsukamurella sp. 1534]
MRRNDSLSVLIAGAGIGGLALAGALHRAGARVTVVERAECFGQAGSGLSLFGNGFRAIDALGIGDLVRGTVADGPPTGTSGSRTPDGTWLVRFPPRTVSELRVVDRTELHAALLAGADGVEILTGAAVVGADDTGVRLEGGGRLGGFDLVVGADGLRSGVRAGWPGTPRPAYAGYGSWRGITRHAIQLDGGGETLGRGRRFGMVPLRDGRVYWFASISAPEHARPGLAVLRSTFGGWHDPIGAVLAATDEDAISYLPIEFLAPPLRRYVHGRRVLLGDAAHAMTPDLGQGANQALEDAAVLASVLAPSAAAPHEGTVDAALQDYDRRRRRRSQAIAAQARTLGRVAQAAGPIAMTRDALMRIAPGAVAARQVARIQDWRP